jgi:CheY-like chemotaxis protein
VADLVAPSDVPALADAYRTTLEAGRCTTVRLHIRSGHGAALAFEATAFAIRDAVGRAPALTLSLRRTEGLNDLSPVDGSGGSESARLRTVVDGAQLGTWDWHLPSGALLFNARWADMLGYRLDDIAERLFEPFFTTKFAGRGMRLSAVLGITRVHGGAILFEPGADTGASFHLYFPALEGAAAVPHVESVSEPDEPAPTVLIVDDEAVVRRAGRRLLEALGYRVLDADDGDVALDIWQSNRSDVDLVILDMTMPRLDGCDTLAQLREWAPDLKVLITSGYSEREVLARSKDHIPSGCVPKPFRLQQVQESIEEILATPRG